MTQGSETSGNPSTPATPAAMAREIDTLAAQLASLRQLQAGGRKQMRFIVVIIIAMFAVFMWAAYSRIKGNFNDAAVQKAVSDRAAEFVPKAVDRLSSAAQNAAPTYRALAMARLEVVGPQMASDAQKRLKSVPQENAEVMHAEVQSAFDNVVTRIDPDVREAFPSLTDERKHAILAEFHKDVDAENQKINTHVEQIWTAELIRLNNVLSKYDTAMQPGQKQDAAERDFLHAMVMYVDFLVTAESPAAATPAPTTQTAVR